MVEYQIRQKKRVFKDVLFSITQIPVPAAVETLVKMGGLVHLVEHLSPVRAN
jgi:hypothetical protein